MIRYTLKCSKNHVFESWFANAEGYDTLKAAGHVVCAVCGDTNVKKTLMAPAVAQKDDASAELAAPASPQEAMMQKLREHVEANSDYVGGDFAKTARDMHEGVAPDRAIYGEASLADAKALMEEGVPVAPLPFTPTRKTN